MKNNFHWLNPSLAVQETDRYEKGTFAVKKVKKGDLLLVLSGNILTLEEEAALPGSLSDNGIQISERFSLCVTTKNELAGINFFNHSCEPNAGIRGQIFLVAMRDIEKNEEVVFDYGMTLYHSKGSVSYKMKCLCGHKNCRKFITDNDWKIPTLQKKYHGYFQYFIQEKIDDLKK
jgi:SET domain-containing protein